MISGLIRNKRSILLKETTMRLAPLAFIIFTLIWFLAEASDSSNKTENIGPKIPLCETRPVSLDRTKRELPNGMSDLPKGILVARQASYFVEDKQSQNRVLSAHDFLSRQSAILCATVSGEKAMNFSIYGPVLVDLTGKGKVQNSNWQFQIVTDAEKIGAWNQKTRLGKLTKENITQFKIYEIARDQFELIVRRESKLSLELLSVRYEVTADLK